MSATDRLDAGLQAIADGMARVDYGLRQLETADYHVAQAGLEFIEEQLPAVEADVAAIRERPGVTADHIKLANDNLAWVRGVHQALKDGYSEMDTSRLISLAPYAPQSPGGLTNCLCALLGCTIAHAESGRGSYRSGCDSVRGGIDLVGEDRSLAAHRPGWKDIRKAIRGGQTTFGAGVDAIGATIGSISREAAGRYYGNTPEERWKDIKDNFEQVARNWREGTSGSSTYRTLKNGMEQAENAAQAVTRDFVRKTMGGHFAPWAAGKLAKGLVSTFTGLAKGASAVADPTSTDAELAVGVLELGMALTAGNGKVYEFSRQGVRKAMTDATGLGNAKDFLINVLEGYDDDLLKQLVGDAVDGKSLVRSFLEFLEVPPELLDPPSFDGHYSGKIKGGTSGSIHFTIQGGTWQGSVSGSIPWTLGDYQGSMSFRGSLSGSCDPESGALDGTTGGTLGDGDNPSRFSGTISGTVRNGVASGSWTTTGKDETRTGTWSATINE